MVIDTSALIAILRVEPEAEAFKSRIAVDERPCVSAASLVEAHIVLRRNSPPLIRVLSRMLEVAGAEIVPVDREIAQLANWAYDKYGRGTQANLNFGDLFSYATARKLNMPLLFKGQDFIHTDIESAIKTRPFPQP